jgi:hypothetical protein
VRVCDQHGKTMNLNGNQVCRGFCSPQLDRILVVPYERSGLGLPLNITHSSDDRYENTVSVKKSTRNTR